MIRRLLFIAAISAPGLAGAEIIPGPPPLTMPAGGVLCGTLPAPSYCPNSVTYHSFVQIPAFNIAGNGTNALADGNSYPVGAGLIFSTVLVGGVTPTLELTADPAFVLTSLGTPALSGTGLGTSPTIATATGSIAGAITVGSSPANGTFTLTFPTAATNGITCEMRDITANASLVIGQTAYTTTTAVFQAYSRTTGETAALVAANVLTEQCAPF